MKSRAKRASKGEIAIRMYNVGFGDSFLLSVPGPTTNDRPRWMLIDCGVHPSGPGPRKIKDVVEDIIADVSQDGAPRIDVVIATHRHADHVSGFGDERWSDVAVGEVWMPWTEDPKSAKARKIRETQSKLALLLTSKPGIDARVRELALNSLTNESAMDTLHNGFSGNPRRRFLPPTQRKRATFTTAVLPGATIHAMAPSHDEDVIRDMNPPKGESYLRAAQETETSKTTPARPFATSWTYPRADGLPPHLAHLALAERAIAMLKFIARDNELAVATSLENAVNGTSLVLLFEIGKAKLLFPGDAQWGTWTWMMEDDQWRDLLSQTTFYKVGHHGSHNATVPAVVDGLRKPTLGMMSTRAGTKDWDIPREPLLSALRKKCSIVRSDAADMPDPASCKRDADDYCVDAVLSS